MSYLKGMKLILFGYAHMISFSCLSSDTILGSKNAAKWIRVYCYKDISIHDLLRYQWPCRYSGGQWVATLVFQIFAHRISKGGN